MVKVKVDKDWNSDLLLLADKGWNFALVEEVGNGLNCYFTSRIDEF